MPDPVETHSLAEPSSVEEPAPQRPTRKASGRKGTKPSTRKASKRGSARNLNCAREGGWSHHRIAEEPGSEPDRQR